MVLQRAPKRAMLWGFSAPASQVHVRLDANAALTAITNANGTWRLALPPTLATAVAHIITISNATMTTTLVDVLFGEVFLCGGQSNMAYSVSGMTNSTAVAANADQYSHTNGIRIFTVGDNTTGERSRVPLEYFPSVEQGWVAASSSSVDDGQLFGAFSAVCWEMGRTIHNGLGGRIPVGLISSNWPGTTVQAWTPDPVYRKCCALFPGQHGAMGCAPLGTQGNLFNEMIAPFAHGPMSLAGASWYQGESNTVANNATLPYNAGARFYACCFPAMITAWRAAFGVDNLFFGFVQLSTWCNPDQSGIAPMRGQLGVPTAEAGQMAAMGLANVAYATNADHGNGCGIHPPDKQYPGERLGRAALNLVYKQEDVEWQSPTYAGAAAVEVDDNACTISVTVSLTGVGPAGLELIYPFNQAKLDEAHTTCEQLDIQANETGTCGWAAIEINGARWLNASVEVAVGGGGLILSAVMVGAGGAGQGGLDNVTATAYGYAPIPMMNAYDAGNGLPVLPWNRAVKARF